LSVSVSGPVYAAVANLKSEADAAVQLLQNQVAVAQQAANEYASILSDLVNTDAAPPAPIEPQPTPPDAQGIG